MTNTPAPTRGPLRELREDQMLTQVDLARMAGIDRATVIRLEQDPTRAYNQTIIKIAAVLGVDPQELRDQFRAAV